MQEENLDFLFSEIDKKGTVWYNEIEKRYRWEGIT